MSERINAAEFVKQFNSLSVNEINKLLKGYVEENDADLSKEKHRFIIEDLQSKLKKYGINNACPHFGSSDVVSFGKNGNVQRFKCKACNKTFTPFTNTILEKTKYGWDVWVKMVEMVFEGHKIQYMHEILKKNYGLDSLNYKTVFLWVHKIIHAMAQMPMPNLSGVIQIDETFFRESQKGCSKLVSTLKGVERLPRYGRQSACYNIKCNTKNFQKRIDNIQTKV